MWSLSPILERATEVIVAAVLVTTKIIGRRMESVTSGTVRSSDTKIYVGVILKIHTICYLLINIGGLWSS